MVPSFRMCLLAFCVATTFAQTVPARAEIAQIPAIAFVGRSDVQVVGDSQMGTLTNAMGTFYAPVHFPTDGVVVCRFVLVHRDNDGDFGITARLMKKRIIAGDLPFREPIQMARTITGGGKAGVRILSDTSIRQATVDLANAFYYVELIVPATTLIILGVQIEYGSTC